MNELKFNEMFVNEFVNTFGDEEFVNSKANILFKTLDSLLVANKMCNKIPVVLGMTRQDFYLLTRYLTNNYKLYENKEDTALASYNGYPIVLSNTTEWLYPIDKSI